MTGEPTRDEMTWEIETKRGYHGWEWRVWPSTAKTKTPWVGSFRFRNSAIRAARRYCRGFVEGTWTDVERVKLHSRKVDWS